MKRILMCVALATLAASAFAAGTPEATKSAVAVSKPNEFPIVTTPVTLKFTARLHPIVQDMATNDMTKYMEEKTGVRIEWEQVPQNALTEKRTLLLASGDYPDALFSMGVTREEEMTYGPQGVFVQLNDLIAKHAPNLTAIYAEKPYYRQQATTPDGKIYSMPHINECFHCSMSQKMWINQPWLTKLGLKMPTTTEEFYQALKAFKTRDPNGNGKADEVPLSGALKAWHTEMPSFLMNAFIYFEENGDSTLYFRVQSGKIDFVADKPEWRDGMRYMARLYKEGLIDPAAFTQDGTQLVALGESPDAPILGAVPGGGPNQFTKNGAPSGRYKIYEPVPPLSGPKGFRTIGYYPFVASSDFVITNKAQYPEVAVKWVDHLYDRHATLRSVFGREGPDWRYAKPDEIGINGKPAIWYRETAFGTLQNSLWAQVGPSYRPIELRGGEKAADDLYSVQGLNTRLERASQEVYDIGVAPKEVFMPVYMTEAQAAENAQLRTSVRDYVSEMTARFIIGEVSLETGWDGYVKELQNIGVARFVELNQKAYDAQYRNK